jgi:hypothetical protein
MNARKIILLKNKMRNQKHNYLSCEAPTDARREIHLGD